MAELDSLQISITADAKKASDAIDALAESLLGLGQSIAPAAKGLNDVATALGSITAYKKDLGGLSKSFTSLSKSWAGLTSATAKANAGVAQFDAQARSMANTLAKEWGIKSKAQVAELTNALQAMYNAAGDTVGVGKALGAVEKLIKTHSQFKITANENAAALRKFINQSTISLDKIILKSEKYKEIWGKLGGKVGPGGSSPTELVKEFNKNGGGAVDISGLDSEEKVLEKIIATLAHAKDETLSFADVARNASTYESEFGNVTTSLNNTLEIWLIL